MAYSSRRDTSETFNIQQTLIKTNIHNMQNEANNDLS